MIREDCPRHRLGNTGHVATKTVALGACGAGGPSIRSVDCRLSLFVLQIKRGVALETDGFIIGWDSAGVPVWIVAGDATQCTTLGVASALYQGGGLEADEVGARGRRGIRGLVALPAKRHNPLGRGEPGPRDGEVGKPLLDRTQVMPARAVTPLATDSMIASFRPSSGLLDGSKVRRMAVDASTEGLVGDRTTQIAI